jgi:hypothetical protein
VKRGTLIYLHGFRSAAASEKARATQAFITTHHPAVQLHTPTLSHCPDQAFAEIAALVNTADPHTDLGFIGSSLGGYYAMCAVERFAGRARATLVNPAVFPERDLAAYIGRIDNMVTGETFVWCASHLEQLRAMQHTTLRDASRYLLCVETGDEVLDYQEACAKYAAAQQIVVQGGNHRFQAYEHVLPNIVDFLLP